MTVQDNYYCQQKAQILINAIARSNVKNFTFVNIAQAFDVKGNNYSDFQKYMQSVYQFIKFGDISWGNKFV